MDFKAGPLSISRWRDGLVMRLIRGSVVVVDLKVCGDDAGVSTFQLDIKCEGLTFELLDRALAQVSSIAANDAHLMAWCCIQKLCISSTASAGMRGGGLGSGPLTRHAHPPVPSPRAAPALVKRCLAEKMRGVSRCRRLMRRCVFGSVRAGEAGPAAHPVADEGGDPRAPAGGPLPRAADRAHVHPPQPHRKAHRWVPAPLPKGIVLSGKG
jgi:hypothetical protein